MQKLIKDIVHGYISFDKEMMNIVNSPEFQRLKNIRQTSYNSLYPSSLHDRFTHSIGVYQLAKFAYSHFKENFSVDFTDEQQSEEFWKTTENVFLLACLLHDIGHSPFSHTGEYFYLKQMSNTASVNVGEKNIYIYEELIKVVNDEEFEQQFRQSITNRTVAKPHEIMSAILGLKKWMTSNTKEERILFTRMIIGQKYSNYNEIKKGIFNALITLLNSSVIDVDKLDYLMRDKMMTGFQGVNIDTERLLSSVCLVNKKEGRKNNFYLGYYKNALSVIENVVIAHDSEKKWIQTHSVVSYDSFLVQRCIKAIESNFSKGTSIFCEEALGCTGVQLEHQNIRLLSDSDIIYLAKQINQEDANYKYIDEYFNRGARKKSIWKSESEFDLMLRELGENDRRKFMNWMRELTEDLKDCVNSVNDSLIIDDNILKEKEKDYLQKQGDNEINQIEKDSAKEVYESIKTKIDTLKQIAKIFETDFNFVITWHNRFESNVKKFGNDEVLIKYKNFEEPKPIGEVISTYSLNKKTSTEGFSNIYYLFYKRENKTIKPVEFIKKFVELIA